MTTTTPTASDFPTLKADLEALKRAYHAGSRDVPYSRLLTAAKATADAYNAEATRIARQFKRSPKLITPAGLLR